MTEPKTRQELVTKVASKREVLVDLVKKSTSVLFDGYTWKIDHTKPVTDGFYALLTEGTSSPVFINFDNVPACRVFLTESIINEKSEKEEQMTSQTLPSEESPNDSGLINKTAVMKVVSVATEFLPDGYVGRRYKVVSVNFSAGTFCCVLEATGDEFEFGVSDITSASIFAHGDNTVITNVLEPQMKISVAQGRTVSTFNLT